MCMRLYDAATAHSRHPQGEVPWVDVVFGTHNLHKLPQLLENLYAQRKSSLRYGPRAAI